jgi:serine/threonine protein kinase
MDLPTLSWNDITIESKKCLLGKGSFAVVVKAKWKRSNGTVKDIAIKLITESMLWDRDYNIEKGLVLSEAKIILQARTAHVVNIVDVLAVVDGSLPKPVADALPVGKEGEGAFGIVMGYIDCVPVSSVIHQSSSTSKSMSLPDKIRILCEICSAVVDLHSIGLIHGDIKPQNVLISKQTPPFVYLIDFGLTTLRDKLTAEGSSSDSYHSTIQRTSRTKGTFLYCAPG